MKGIEKILHLISSILSPRKVEEMGSAKDIVTSLSEEVLNEVGSLRQELVSSVFNSSRPREVEFIIQNYQAILIRLLDEVYAANLSKSLNGDVKKSYNTILNGLSGLLTFIENYFVRYFNTDEKVPDVYYSIIKSEFGQQYISLKTALKDKGAVDEWNSILLSRFKAPEADKKPELINYRHLIYLKELFNEIVLIAEKKQDEDVNAIIQNLLIHFNYNDPSFVNYVVIKIAEQIDNEPGVQEKILALKCQKKEINRIQCRTTVSLHKDLMSAKDQIITWIEEESDLLLTECTTVNPKLPDEKDTSELKVNTSLSVPQLAYLVRLLVEDKIITNPNQTDILKFFSTNFTTVKRENVSYAHLRGQYYKAELSAIEAVKSLLLRLVNLTRKIK
jgi:hypothetical protein